ncbi:MAG: hypothetical protein GQ583_05100 [Methyloprofundus sp.]|nr:hypothetical protein [Methyloprofundus sp.]
MYRLFFILLSLSTTGCSGIIFTDKSDTIHHLIIGIGVVSIPKPKGTVDAIVSKSESIGIQFSNQPGLKFGIGYMESSIIEIPEQTENILIDVSQKSFGPLRIRANTNLQEKIHDKN